MAAPLAGANVVVSGQAMSVAFGVVAALALTDSANDCGVSPAPSANETAENATGLLASGPPCTASPPLGTSGAATGALVHQPAPTDDAAPADVAGHASASVRRGKTRSRFIG